MAKELLPRSLNQLLIHELLPEFPAIMVVGARGTGKSTLLTEHADVIFDLSVEATRLAILEDPDGLISSATGTVFVDEWQEAPAVLGSIKRAVDGTLASKAERFLVSGSVRARNQSATWPGTGRFIRVRMTGLTQAELALNANYNPVDTFYATREPTYSPSDLDRGDYLERIVTGRFPDVVNLSERSRDRWYQAYTEQLIDRDASQVSQGPVQSAKLRAVLMSSVARTGQELNSDATARDAGVNNRTVSSNLGLLEDLSILARVPAWNPKRLDRVRKRAKIHVLDPGMACHLLNIDAAGLAVDAALVGQLFETFVASEILSHVETATTRTETLHFRHQAGHEVDVVLERKGRIVGVKVKSATSVDRSDAKGLLWLRDQLGDSFHFGAVLYSGSLPFKIDDRVWALPIDVLWRTNNPVS